MVMMRMIDDSDDSDDHDDNGVSPSHFRYMSPNLKWTGWGT